MNLFFYSNKYIKGIHYGLDTLTIVVAIFAAHWTAILQDGEYSASSYGSVGLQAPEEGDIIEYEDLTEEIVIQWVKDALDVESIESSLEAQIEKQKSPIDASGLPWS